MWDPLQVSAALRLAVSLVRTDDKDTQVTFQFHQRKLTSLCKSIPNTTGSYIPEFQGWLGGLVLNMSLSLFSTFLLVLF